LHVKIAKTMNRSPVPPSAAGVGVDREGEGGGRLDRSLGEIGFVPAVTVAGGWLRLRALGRVSLWFDEVISSLQAQPPSWELLQNVRQDVHPPLYHLLLHGMSALGDSEAVLRIPSALFGILSIPLLYALGRVWFRGPVGALAALLPATSLFHI
jgi:hypothetical protein